MSGVPNPGGGGPENPKLGQWLPKAWAMVAQCLGTGCPMFGQWLPKVGQRLPNAWAMVAQGLGNGCPMLGQWLPKAWAMVAQCLGNGCPMFGQWLPKVGQRFLLRHVLVLFLHLLRRACLKRPVPTETLFGFVFAFAVQSLLEKAGSC